MLCAVALSLAAVMPGSSLAEDAVPESDCVLLPVADDPAVSFRLWFQAGSQNDPPGKEGLAAITASMLAEGATTENDYAKILDLLFPMAADYRASVTVEMTVISGRVHRDNLADYTRLLTDAVCRPAFKQQDLDRLKSQTLNYLQNELRYSSDEDLGKAVLYGRIFAGTRYGHLPEGTVEAVKSITLDDVREFYRKHYTRENVVIGLGGGYEPPFVTELRSSLGQLPPGKPEPVPPPEPQRFSGLKVTIVEKDCPATAISMGYPIGVLRGQPDWYPLAVANSWLGEHRNSSSHLYQVIREARGLNYGDYSYIEHFPYGGRLQLPPQNVGRRRQMFEIWIRPVPHTARHFALRAALREHQRLVEQGMARAEFDLTRRFLGKYILHFAPTTMTRLGYALDDRFYGVPGSHLDLFRRRMGDVRLDEVNAAVRKHLQTADMHIVFITSDAAALKEALVSDAPSPITYATPKPDSVLDEDKAIGTFPLKIRADDVTIVPVEELFVR